MLHQPCDILRRLLPGLYLTDSGYVAFLFACGTPLALAIALASYSGK